MITKERPVNTEQSVNEHEDIKELNNKYNKRLTLLIFIIIFLFVILTLFVVYILSLHNMKVYNPFETKIIKVNSDKKSWYKNDEINLFKYLNEQGEKIIWPGQSGEYEFYIQNTNDVPIYYKISISEKNTDKINMKYRLKQNNVYVIGNEDTYEPIEKMYLEDIKILEKAKSQYTLEWKWEETDKDVEIGKSGLSLYRIYIEVYSKSIGSNISK
ncbi:MAG: hypothetical protein IKM97_00945 [Clostridia bacterium]|nr:hypothetical protein [Clostridia bacterium]